MEKDKKLFFKIKINKMNSKQRREHREKKIALNAWYSCMIAMGGIPMDEDLYFETKKRFLKKHRIKYNNKIKTTCDKDYADVKYKYVDILSYN